MARIPDEEIERLKKEIAIERLVTGFGIELKRTGANLVGRCPFHEDRTPSLIVTPSTNLWRCMGKCNVGGSTIDWVMRTQGVSFRHAAELLRTDHSSLAAGNGHVVRQATTVKLESPIAQDADDQQTLRDVVRFYHDTLKDSPEALRYLESRGLTHPEMIGHFKLGFANRKLGLTLPEKNRKAGAELRGRLERLGILRETSGHEHMNGSVVFPIHDLEGNVLGLYGRKIRNDLRPGTPLHLYLPGPHRGVWNEEALVASQEIILCESIIDALTFWCAGYRNVTASYGVNGFTDDHRAALKKHGTARLLIAYDRDEAGEKAAATLADELLKMGIECFRVLFSKGMDANEYALHVQPAAKSLGMLLNQAHWLGKGKWPGASGQWSDGEHGAELSRSEGVAASHRLGAGSLPAAEEVSERGELRVGGSDPASGGIDCGEHRGGAGEAAHARVPATSIDSQGQPGGTGYAADHSRTLGLSEERGDCAHPVEHDGNPHDASRSVAQPARETLTPDHSPLTTAHEIVIARDDRRYRIRGFAENTSYHLLKINLLASRGDGFHVDTFNLYTAHQCAAFVKQAALELGVSQEIVKGDLRHVLGQLEAMQDEQIRAALTPKPREVTMSEEDRSAALELLRDPKLLDRIVADFERCGLVGEETNKQVAYLATVSRHLDSPLAVVVQSSSAAGKSSLMDAVLQFVPEEERIQYSSMTGQSLFYMGEMDLKHKVLAIVEEGGARSAAYALKLLQSEGVLSIASTGKDPATGKLITHQYRVEGPVMMFLTTTAIDIDEELLNRCLVLAVNEDRAQTQAIHRLQREQQTLEGLMRREERRELIRLHQNAQRLLKPLFVANPYARELTFLDSLTRTRRDHLKYLTLIRAIALLHQHQRPVKTAQHRGKTIEYIEVEPRDIDVANRLIGEVLGRSLDELPPQTRRLLLLIDEYVKAACERLKVERADFHFSRRDVRTATGWHETQLRVHLDRLQEMEYLLAHRGGRGQSFAYELVYEPSADAAKPQLPGLIHIYDTNLAGLEDGFAARSRRQSGAFAATSRPHETRMNTGANGVFPRKPVNGTDTGVGPNPVIGMGAGGR
jgi:DNA primase catalytic core